MSDYCSFISFAPAVSSKNLLLKLFIFLQLFNGIKMLSVTQVKYPPTISTPRYVLYFFEFIFWLLCIFANISFIVILKQTNSVHRNLRLILANMCFVYMVVAMTRFILIYNHIMIEQGLSKTVSTVVITVMKIAISSKTASEVVLLLERVISTIFASKYETNKSRPVTVILVLLCYLYPCITLPLISYNVVGPVIFMPLPIIFDILSWIFTIMLLKINKSSYVTDYYNERNGIIKINLTKRYQTAENIRMLQTIISFLIYSTISNAITCSCFAFYVFYINENKLDDLFAYYDVIWYTINAISACILPLPFILKHEGMKKHFMTLFGWSGLKNIPKTTQNLKSVNGKALITVDNPDTHFNNLKHIWQSD